MKRLQYFMFMLLSSIALFNCGNDDGYTDNPDFKFPFSFSVETDFDGIENLEIAFDLLDKDESLLKNPNKNFTLSFETPNGYLISTEGKIFNSGDPIQITKDEFLEKKYSFVPTSSGRIVVKYYLKNYQGYIAEYTVNYTIVQPTFTVEFDKRVITTFTDKDNEFNFDIKELQDIGKSYKVSLKNITNFSKILLNGKTINDTAFYSIESLTGNKLILNPNTVGKTDVTVEVKNDIKTYKVILSITAQKEGVLLNIDNVYYKEGETENVLKESLRYLGVKDKILYLKDIKIENDLSNKHQIKIYSGLNNIEKIIYRTQVYEPNKYFDFEPQYYADLFIYLKPNSITYGDDTLNFIVKDDNDKESNVRTFDFRLFDNAPKDIKFNINKLSYRNGQSQIDLAESLKFNNFTEQKLYVKDFTVENENSTNNQLKISSSLNNIDRIVYRTQIYEPNKYFDFDAQYYTDLVIIYKAENPVYGNETLSFEMTDDKGTKSNIRKFEFNYSIDAPKDMKIDINNLYYKNNDSETALGTTLRYNTFTDKKFYLKDFRVDNENSTRNKLKISSDVNNIERIVYRNQTFEPNKYFDFEPQYYADLFIYFKSTNINYGNNTISFEMTDDKGTKSNIRKFEFNLFNEAPKDIRLNVNNLYFKETGKETALRNKIKYSTIDDKAIYFKDFTVDNENSTRNKLKISSLKNNIDRIVYRSQTFYPNEYFDFDAQYYNDLFIYLKYGGYAYGDDKINLEMTDDKNTKSNIRTFDYRLYDNITSNIGTDNFWSTFQIGATSDFVAGTSTVPGTATATQSVQNVRTRANLEFNGNGANITKVETNVRVVYKLSGNQVYSNLNTRTNTGTSITLDPNYYMNGTGSFALEIEREIRGNPDLKIYKVSTRNYGYYATIKVTNEFNETQEYTFKSEGRNTFINGQFFDGLDDRQSW